MAETIWSLAGRLSPQRIDRIFDDQLATRNLDVADFDRILDRITGERRPGAPLIRALVDERRRDAYQPATSELESYLYPLLEHPEIPPHQNQRPFSFDEGIEAVLDTFIDAWGMIVEADGRRWHTRRADFERDRRRDNAAAVASLPVLGGRWLVVGL